MKTKGFLTLLLSISLGLLLIAPGVNGAEEFPLKGWPKGIVCGGGSPGSAYYTLMVGISELSSKYLKIKATTIGTAGGSAVGIRGLNKGELDFTAAADMIAFWACEGKGPYKGKIMKNIRAVTGNNPVLVAIMTDAKYGIKSMEDLKGKGYTISLHVKGSSAFSAVADKVLEFYGLGPEDVKSIPHVDKTEATSGLKEGRFKVIVEAAYALQPMPYFMELDRDINMRMIPLSQKCIEFVEKEVPGFGYGSLPPGLYKGISEEKTTVGLNSGVFCRAELPASFVYEVCRLIFEQPSRAEWERLAPYHKLFVPEKAKAFLTPLHAGAVKYYKEKGFWSESMESRQKKVLAEMGVEE